MAWSWSTGANPTATYSGNHQCVNVSWQPLVCAHRVDHPPEADDDSDFVTFLVCVMGEAASRSAARGFGTLGIWLTGGAAATFALAISNSEAVSSLVSQHGLRILLWSCAVCALLGIFQQYLMIMSDSGRDAANLVHEEAKKFGLPISPATTALSEPIATLFAQAFPRHLQKTISGIARRDRYSNVRTAIAKAEFQRIICLVQLGACTVGMVGPMILALTGV